MKKFRGSLSLEAVISFTVFICFMFMLLTVVKLALVRITLNTATAETAKQIATASYPLSHLIEWQRTEQKKISNYENRIKLTEGINSGVDSTLFGSGGEASGVAGVLNQIAGISGDALKMNGVQAVQDLVGDIYSKFGAEVACSIFNSYIENSGVSFDKENIELAIVKFPQAEGCSYGISAEKCQAAGIDEKAYSAEDIVISVEYKYELALPFLPSFEIVMRETAVEHAWIYGGGGSPVKRGDQSVIKDVTDEFADVVFGKDRVYLGAMLSGKKYHKKDCPRLWKGSIMTSKLQAEKEFYTACKVCKP